MGKLSNTTSAVFEFIHDQTVENADGKRLHEFDIVKRFTPIIGHANTIDVLERLSKKHHILKSTSTQKTTRGRPTYYYRANPENVYYDTGAGRKPSPEVLKKLEKLRGVPVGDLAEENEPFSEAAAKGIATVMAQEAPASAVQANGAAEHLDRADVLSLVQDISEQQGRDSVSLILDFGNSRTEIVDVGTGYKLYLGLKAVFELK
jgi:hypothetical protein